MNSSTKSFSQLFASMLLLVFALPATYAEHPGKADFQRYCMDCHGPEGTGNGYISHYLKISPSNLTVIAKKHGGEFPFQKMMKIIDGRVDGHSSIRTIGSNEMPAWGALFEDETGSLVAKEVARLRVKNLTSYIKSIQK